MQPVHRFLTILFVLCLSTAAFAATISAPVRPTSSPAKAARFAAAGQEALDFDAGALSALRQAGQEPTVIENFPIAPGALARVVLTRFEVASPDAHISVRGAAGETRLP